MHIVDPIVAFTGILQQQGPVMSAKMKRHPLQDAFSYELLVGRGLRSGRVVAHVLHLFRRQLVDAESHCRQF